MKRLLLILFTVFALQMNAQDVVGDWNGVLSFQGTELRIVFHVTGENIQYQSTMDSPDQNGFGIPTDKTTFEKGKITITSDQMQMKYEAELESDGKTLKGTFNQGPVTIPLVMTKQKKN